MTTMERLDRLHALIARRPVLVRQLAGLRARTAKAEAKLVALDAEIRQADAESETLT